jgi:hypothetical protein
MILSFLEIKAHILDLHELLLAKECRTIRNVESESFEIIGDDERGPSEAFIDHEALLILGKLEKVLISEIKEVIPNRNTSEILELCRNNDVEENLDKWQRLIIK